MPFGLAGGSSSLSASQVMATSGMHGHCQMWAQLAHISFWPHHLLRLLLSTFASSLHSYAKLPPLFPSINGFLLETSLSSKPANSYILYVRLPLNLTLIIVWVSEIVLIIYVYFDRINYLIYINCFSLHLK